MGASVVAFNNGVTAVRYGDMHGNWEDTAPSRLANFVMGYDVETHETPYLNDGMLEFIRPVDNFWDTDKGIADLEVVTGKRILGISLGQWLVKYPGSFYRVLSNNAYIEQVVGTPAARPFRKELEVLLNKHSKDAEVGIPDWILANHIVHHLTILGKTVADARTHEVAE